MKATGAVKWRTHLALLFVLVLGIVLSPLRAVAATIPALFAYDVAIQGTATAPLGRIYAVPPERGGLPEYAYDAAHVGYDGTVNPQAVARAVATRAYGPTLTFLNRREVGEGVIYDALAATAAAEGAPAALRFSQTTASAAFSADGAFAGKTIGSLAGELRAGTMAASNVPVGVTNGLIVNTRSSLALMRAGIPQSNWVLIDATESEGANIAARLIRNGLGPEGTPTLRLTGLGSGASSLE
jgi:hypothetical protein